MSPIGAVSFAAALSILGSISRVSAHGFVAGVVIGGEYYTGFDPSSAPFQNPPPPVIGWPNSARDTGFVPVSDFGNPNIICHLNASPGEKHAKVAAGSSIDLQWNQWDASHHGPVIDYMAKCDGECEKADKNALKFFKIDEAGLVNGSPAPGTWATDKLMANNLTWTVTIPASIAPGNYVLRHEMIALHNANKPNGAQAYPQCINLEVTGTGTENPAGIPATEFYTATDPGISLSIYYPALENYTIPGPPLFSGASSGGNGTSPGMTGVSSVAVVPATSPEAASSTSASEGISSTASAQVDPPAVATGSSGQTATSDQPKTSEATGETCGTTTEYETTTVTNTVVSGSTATDVSPAANLENGGKGRQHARDFGM